MESLTEEEKDYLCYLLLQSAARTKGQYLDILDIILPKLDMAPNLNRMTKKLQKRMSWRLKNDSAIHKKQDPTSSR